MNYHEYINDKSVVFVGACPNIKGMDKGVLIDKFDVVIKTNGSLFLSGDEYYKDYGKRIDVLYTNNQFYREMSPLPIEEAKEKGLKYLRMKTCYNIQSLNDQINAEIIRGAIDEVNKHLEGAVMGAYIYNDILRCNPKKLFIIGVDFFASKKKKFEHDDYHEYIKGYLPDKIRKQGNRINKGKLKDGHNFRENAKYIYGLYLQHDNFVMPEYTEKLLIEIVNGEIDQL